MNRVYGHIWSKALGRLVVTPECAGGGRGKRSRRRKRAVALMASTLLASPAFAGGTLPTGGQVVSGSATISTSGTAMTINQSSDRMIANWQSFSIGRDNAVTFNQPGASSVALNRVVGQDPSRILGSLTANGQVFLVNPNGIAIGKSGSVQTGGFVASTLGIADQDFLAGDYRFTGSGSGAIVNRGDVSGRVVALISPSVANQGTITGDAALAAGTDVLLDFDGDGLLSVEVKASTVATLVENEGLIRADGGTVILTARGASEAMKGVVNNSGTVEANIIADRGGRILLLGDMEHGEVNAAGTLRAEFVETSAAEVNLDRNLTVDTQGGRWLIDPIDITIGADEAAAIQTSLASGDVEISTAGPGSDAGDITVDASITWGSNILTLRADNDITINAALTSTGTTASDGLVLQYAQTTATGDYFINAPVNLASGSLFQTRQGSDAAVTWTVITDIDALQDIINNPSGNYALGANIDASATATWNSGAGFAPIGNISNLFSGALDGLGHVISDLVIDRPSDDRVGLFGWINQGAVVQNVGIEGGSISGNLAVGSLAGLHLGSIANAWSTASVTGSTNVGGLVGYSNGAIANAHATGNVSGAHFVGGLVGQSNYDGSIANAYATGNVTSAGSNIGGLVGSNYGDIANAYAAGSVTGDDRVGGLAGYSSGFITNAYATGSVTGTLYVGGLVGYGDDTITNVYATGSVTGGGDVGGLMGGGSGTVTNGYWVEETTGQATSVGETRLDTVADLTAALPSGFDAAVWGNQNDRTSPYLLGSLPLSFYIGSDTDLYSVIYTLDQLQAMQNNLAGRYALLQDIDASATATWNSGAGFAPIGNVSNHFSGVLDGLGHVISDLVIDRPSDNHVGLFGVTGSTAEVRNVGLEGGSVRGNQSVGALAGTHLGSIANAWSTASVSGNFNVGGLLGVNSSGSVSDSYATGAVSGGSRVGGLAAVNTGTVRNTYATGSVTAHDEAGGLVGYNLNSGTVEASYATGTVVSGGSDVGGLVGRQDNGGTVLTSFYDRDTTGQSDTGKGIGLTTAEMRNPFTFIDTGWDFASTWGKSSAGENDGYMMLRGVGPGSLYDDYVRLSGTDLSKTYGDANPLLDSIAFSGLGAGNITLAWGNAIHQTTNAGTYAYSGANVLDISTTSPGGVYVDYGTGALTIDKALLIATANSLTKTYDGTGFSGGNGVSYAGFVAGENASVLSGSVTYGGTAQGARNAGSYTLTASGLSSQNYDIAYASGALTINRAVISSVSGITADNKVYDGTTAAALGLGGARFAGLVAGDSLTVATASGTFADPDPGVGKTVLITGLSLGGADAGNYLLADTTALATADIIEVPVAQPAPPLPSLPPLPPLLPWQILPEGQLPPDADLAETLLPVDDLLALPAPEASRAVLCDTQRFVICEN